MRVAFGESGGSMKRKAVLILALALAGCVPDQAKDLAGCEAQAERFYPLFKAVEPNAPASRYLIECMASKGYDFSVTPTDCDSQRQLPTQAACYTPANWAASLFDSARRYWKSF
jgi:hypothetical protein